MATFQIAPPEKFDFSQPDEWPKWLRRFERFRVASGVSANEEENQVNMLVYSMGERADDILHTFNLSVENKKKYDPVIEKFNAYFVKKRNTIFERTKSILSSPTCTVWWNTAPMEFFKTKWSETGLWWVYKMLNCRKNFNWIQH